MGLSWLAVSADVVNWRLIRFPLIVSALYSGALIMAGAGDGLGAVWIRESGPFMETVSVFAPYASSFAESVVQHGSLRQPELLEHLLLAILIITLVSLFGSYLVSIWRLKSRPLTLLRRRREMTAQYEAVSCYFLFLVAIFFIPYLPAMLLSHSSFGFAQSLIIQVVDSDLGLGFWCLLASISAGCLYFHVVRTLVWFSLWLLGLFTTRTFAILWR